MRYGFYLPTRGRLGPEMMKRTATVQVNLDFADEAEAIEKMRVALAASPVVTALFASSPISEFDVKNNLKTDAEVRESMEGSKSN